MMRVLVTGAGGYIGRRLTAGLEGEFELRLGDVWPIDDPRFVGLDVTDPRQAYAAAQGIEAIIHLAIASGHEGEHEDDEFNGRRFDVNVKGTMNVLSAARRAGVRRFVFTSSLMVVWGYQPPALVASHAPARPVGTYAVTKHLGEVLCEDAARNEGLSIVCLRIPKPVDVDDPVWKKGPVRPQWLAFPDLIQAYRLALLVREIGFEIITVVGESSRRRWDLSKAERVLGYRPTCRLEDLGFRLGEENEPYPT
ncbi:MAG: NAD(P)-dependent oxidoreductase [Planctomycetia bacterium]|nr:NAD(P)-dependent oxidoreductase [Planctomycetia bacterium]